MMMDMRTNINIPLDVKKHMRENLCIKSISDELVKLYKEKWMNKERLEEELKFHESRTLKLKKLIQQVNSQKQLSISKQEFDWIIDYAVKKSQEGFEIKKIMRNFNHRFNQHLTHRQFRIHLDLARIEYAKNPKPRRKWDMDQE